MVTESFWRGRRVFVTGHTGFKGSWLVMWLTQMGAQVTGFSLPAEEISLFRQAELSETVTHLEGDIRDLPAVEAAVASSQPEILFHLAAQPLVRRSYDFPVETFATNVQGTAHVLEACRSVPELKAIVCVTSDKCYDNREWVWPYRESDPMGGHDPYSASKGAAELVISAYRQSYFEEGPLVASVRAGNVIGGGDWAADRLIPDLIRALVAGKSPFIRSPASIRPWQHVLEALGGYLLVARHLVEGQKEAATGWNFGPTEDDARPVHWIADQVCAAWGGATWRTEEESMPHEARVLKLDCSKARSGLSWRPVLRLEQALALIVAWHRSVMNGESPAQVSAAQLTSYRKQLAMALPGRGVEI